MVTLLIIGIVAFILGIIVSVDEASPVGFSLGTIGSAAVTIALLAMQYNSKPSAIDVYKGKTTLEITYRDGVPVDSVVVFKNQED